MLQNLWCPAVITGQHSKGMVKTGTSQGCKRAPSTTAPTTPRQFEGDSQQLDVISRESRTSANFLVQLISSNQGIHGRAIHQNFPQNKAFPAVRTIDPEGVARNPPRCLCEMCRFLPMVKLVFQFISSNQGLERRALHEWKAQNKSFAGIRTLDPWAWPRTRLNVIVKNEECSNLFFKVKSASEGQNGLGVPGQ